MDSIGPSTIECQWSSFSASGGGFWLAANEEQRAVHRSDLLSARDREVVLDDALEGADTLLRPVVQAQARPTAHQFQHPGLGVRLGGRERGHVAELGEHEVVDRPGLGAVLERLNVGQVGIQDDEQSDLLAPALEFPGDGEGDVPAE